jgi:hypothetical protein
MILLGMAITSMRVSAGALNARRRLGRVLLAFGGIYFGGMVLRLLLSLTVWPESPFFARPVPIVFHLVLASFLLLCGSYHTHAAPAAAGSGAEK